MKVRGTYQTKQQEAIAALFQANTALCLTADEIHLQLSEKGEDIGRTTVYRAITRLCGENKLRRYAPHQSGEAACYQWNPCKENHLHIRCVNCGALAHLHCAEVQEFCRHIASDHGFVLAEGQTVLYGICHQCGQTQGKEETQS